MLAILVNRSEEMSTATHRLVVHRRVVGRCSYPPSSRSERSDDAESSFNSEYIGEERAIVPTLSPKRVRGMIVKVQKASFGAYDFPPGSREAKSIHRTSVDIDSPSYGPPEPPSSCFSLRSRAHQVIARIPWWHRIAAAKPGKKLGLRS